jgi:hypothetical protein
MLGLGLIAVPFITEIDSEQGWYTKKTDSLAIKRGLITSGHYDLRQLSNYNIGRWRQYPSHQDYFYEVYNAWREELSISATLVVFAHCVKAQGWGLQGTKSRIPDHNNLGAWCSPSQALDGNTPFFVAKDPAIGGQCFLYFNNWQGMIAYYLSRFKSRQYLTRHFGPSKSPTSIRESEVQAYMRFIKRWLSSKTDPEKFGSTMYGYIKRTRNWI